MVDGMVYLAAFLQVLLEKLKSRELLDFAQHEGEGVLEELKKWSISLKMIQAVLSDAEEKQLTCKAVKLWLDDLRDLAYHMEDVLDKFFTQLLQLKIENLNQGSSSQVWSFVLSCAASFGNLFNFDLEIGEVTRRLEDISQRKDGLGLNDIGGSVMGLNRPSSSRLPDGAAIVRDQYKRKIVKLLLRNQQNYNNFDVVGIVGKPGVGKTTLARLVFQDDDAVEHFDIKVWVSVSDNFDYVRLTKAILKSIDSSEIVNNEELSKLVERVTKTLAGKKFLIILDDVWNTKNDLCDIWLALRSHFRDGAPGSKIIVTTREGHVAEVMGAVRNYTLESVSDDDCWNVFLQNAFIIRNTSELPNLGSLRKKIVAKCNGLPLAASTLGSLLCCREINEWDDILNDRFWTLSDQSNILPLLRLSYHHLPSHLKRCFSYCAILPEHYEFEEKQLVLLWMAEGLIQHPERSRHVEDLGREYFHELVSRSFFQKSRKNESKYVMHELMNDLAQWVAGETCFRMEDGLDGTKKCKTFERARHSSYIKGGFDGIQRLGVFSEFKHLRTFLPFAQSYSDNERGFLSDNVPFHIIPKLQYLRVLSLKGYCIVNLPDSISELKLLRYLDLSHTNIVSLPETITSIYNLQTLMLEYCHDLNLLPTGMKNLTNLHHLYNSNQYLKGMPQDLGKLTNLQTLSDFVVGKENGFSGVGELGPLLHLGGTLSIFGLENVNGAKDAAMANLADKNGIEELLLHWSQGEITDLDVLERLQPPRLIKELIIKRYGGLEFPSWMGNPSFSSMVRVRLEDCNGCRLLPPLGQLVSLKELIIERMPGIESIGIEFYGKGCLKPFPSLETLSFENMENLKEWFPVEANNGIEVFPLLKHLVVRRCKKLKGELPHIPSSLSKLVVDDCAELLVLIPMNQMLCELDIKNCKEVVFENGADVKSLRFMQGLERLQELKVNCCKGMSFLWQNGLQQLTCLRHLVLDDSSLQHPTLEETRKIEMWLPAKLETLELRKCDNLVKVPEGLHLMLLQELYISDCPSLTSFPESSLPSSLRILEIQHCKNLISLVQEDFTYRANKSLELLHVRNCPSLKSISSTNGSLPARFKHLSIRYCPALQCLSWGKLPDNLRKLDIQDCENLICLSPSGELPEVLESFQIWSCKRIESLSLEAGLPKSLRRLIIYNCGQLKTITDRFDGSSCLQYINIQWCKELRSLPEGHHHLINLSTLYIEKCGNLVCFTEGRGLLPSTLRELHVNYCDSMVVYPKGIQNLFSLRRLEIPYTEGFMKVVEEVGFPPNLSELTIWELRVCKPLLKLGLYRVSTLRHLHLNGEATDIVSFPPEPEEEGEVVHDVVERRTMLPSSLTSLRIESFKNLDKLSSGIQCLISLQCLSIYDCQQLSSFPQGGLPLSLQRLEIAECPLLWEQCDRDEAELWPLIAHIPYIEYDFFQV